MTTGDIVNRLRICAADGSKAEKRLAEIILADISYASQAPIADIALRAGVSEPTVTRFCRALGCEGVRDFKFQLAQVLAIGGLYLFPEPLVRDERDARVLDAVTDGATAAMQRVRDVIDMSVVNAVAEMAVNAKHICAYGSGGVSSMGAVEMQNRLFRLGLSIVSHTDGQMQRMSAAVCDKHSLVFAISASGQANSVIESVGIARQYGARTVAITSPESDLAKEADVALPFIIAPDTQLFKPTSGRYALLFIIDLIAMTTAELIGPSVLEGLRRIRISLSGLNMSDPGRPVGD
ncbi:MurR/RpiR family transcriptional regulator [Rhodobium gokarnense]|uniref:DNA-binding MurR/RpiR family transcriptional regulator n=1 Tax=Rhodobium gokarnense TaxID=364296 RepID=A0ABT3HC80_9HYPH|nr:MurR/RpiR family transcriptional regulator [Rhodobium gokarnense]MCW2307975.1 DNA-binding MurR/RpiR family transcriptional regulator [Rhodobium gokarnense]